MFKIWMMSLCRLERILKISEENSDAAEMQEADVVLHEMIEASSDAAERLQPSVQGLLDQRYFMRRSAGCAYGERKTRAV